MKDRDASGPAIMAALLLGLLLACPFWLALVAVVLAVAR